MVTMYTQNLNEFELHLRAIIGLPIPKIELLREGASHVIKCNKNMPKNSKYKVTGLSEALAIDNIDIRIFGKPYAHANRRIGVVLGDNRENIIR